MKYCVLLLSTEDCVDVTIHKDATEAFEHAVEWIEDFYPRERIRNMRELREFEEDNGVCLEFRSLNSDTLYISEP